MITEATFRLEFLHPKYWGWWLTHIFLKITSYLPISWQMVFGKWAGRLYTWLLPYRRHIAECNLKLCFPELSKTKRQRLLRLNMEESGRALFDTANAWYWSNKSVREHMEILGEQHIKEAEEQGYGIILLAVHSLAIEMGLRIVGQLRASFGFYRVHNNPVFEYIQTKGRLRSNKALLSKGETRQMIRALKAGEIVAYTPDQAPARKSAVFVPFFAVEYAATITATARLAKAGGAKLCPFFIERKNNGKYLTEILTPLENFPSGCLETDARRLNSILEKLILRRPEQYLWVHRRFKTQLDPEADSYYS